MPTYLTLKDNFVKIECCRYLVLGKLLLVSFRCSLSFVLCSTCTRCDRKSVFVLILRSMSKFLFFGLRDNHHCKRFTNHPLLILIRYPLLWQFLVYFSVLTWLAPSMLQLYVLGSYLCSSQLRLLLLLFNVMARVLRPNSQSPSVLAVHLDFFPL